MKESTKNTLILGIGNDILTDDGIGPKLVQELQKEINHPDIVFDTAAAGGLEILEIIKNFKKVIIIDAIKTKDGIPGTIYYLTPSHFKETLHISSFHDVNFLTALELAEELSIPVPSQIEIIAIEILEDLTFSADFSPPIAEKYPDILSEVMGSVRKFISGA
ncbi:hydrogenase maturation protease [Bacteroidota bacterium]